MARSLKIATESVAPSPPVSGDDDLRLGSILARLGKLNEIQVEAVLAEQGRSRRRFGDIAVALGFVSQSDVTLALARQHAVEIEPPRKIDVGENLAVLADVDSQQGEVLRGVRSQLMLHWFRDEIEQRCLAVVSTDHGDGRSFVCAALAALIAQLDEDTLIIDADLRRPRMHEIFRLDNANGLSNLLINPAERPRLQTVAGIDRLHVLPAGPFRDNPTEMLARRSFGVLLESLARRFPFVLIDTPPAATCAEALTIAVRSSGCLIVTRRHSTRVSEVEEMSRLMKRHGVEVVGALINDY
jgi:chain length determinant protein tyrosine kinase EpsG